MPVNQPGGVGAGSPYSPQKFNLPATVQDQGVPPGFSNDGASASFGGIRNTAQIRHATGDDEFIPSPAIAIDDSDSWWGGVLNCAAQIALAASLSLTSGLTAAAQQPHIQDEIPSTPETSSDGASASFGGIRHAWQTRYVIGEADWPTPPAAFTPDEDYWPSPPAQVSAGMARVYLPDGDDTPLPRLDEDYWQGGPQPSPLILQRQPLTEDDVFPRFVEGDEDYWQNPTSFVAPTNGRLYLPDSDELSTVKLVEDYWQNPAPAQPLTPAQLYLFDSGELPQPPAVTLVDEDYWQTSWTQVIPPSGLYQPASDDEFIFTAAVTATPEEDYNWTSLPLVGNNSGSGNTLLNYLGLPLGEGDGFISTPAPPGAAAIDERYTYDRYATGLYLTGHTSIGEDL